nr:phage portal protein [Anaerolineae bacterium]
MPAITNYDPTNKALRALADDELFQRRTRISKHRAYYDGEHPSQLTDMRDNITLNLCKQVIDQTVAFLLPHMPNFELDGDDAYRSERETWLRQCWERNGGASAVHQMALNGALSGHVFARVIPDAPFPRIVPLNPANVIIWWRADDWQTVVAYEIRWEGADGRYRQDVYKEGAEWIVRDYAQNQVQKRRGTSAFSDWQLVTEARLPYPPVISWGHLPAINHHYGRDELGDLVGLNLHINKVASDIKSILRYHAYPTTVGTGFSAKDVQETRIDGFLTIPDKDARVFNVEMQSDLNSSLALLDRLESHFMAISRVVMMRPDWESFRGMTNLAVRTAYLPML